MKFSRCLEEDETETSITYNFYSGWGRFQICLEEYSDNYTASFKIIKACHDIVKYTAFKSCAVQQQTSKWITCSAIGMQPDTELRQYRTYTGFVDINNHRESPPSYFSLSFLSNSLDSHLPFFGIGI